MITAAGVPVYFHYCGGELEKISYVVKAGNCCESDEDTDAGDDGCCKNEGFILKSNPDFTVAQFCIYQPVKTEHLLFYIPSFQLKSSLNHFSPSILCSEPWPPPNIQNKIISTSVLRI
ncbi:MAG: hypothetical protein PSX36_00560 [bacterium]|nr:hypothetical protein [bacterium]